MATSLFSFVYLPCGCQASDLHLQTCNVQPPAPCPPLRIPFRNACCEAAVLCRAESASADLAACAFKQAKVGWVSDSQTSTGQSTALYVAASILAGTCGPERAACVRDAIRKFLPRTTSC